MTTFTVLQGGKKDQSNVADAIIQRAMLGAVAVKIHRQWPKNKGLLAWVAFYGRDEANKIIAEQMAESDADDAFEALDNACNALALEHMSLYPHKYSKNIKTREKQ